MHAKKLGYAYNLDKKIRKKFIVPLLKISWPLTFIKKTIGYIMHKFIIKMRHLSRKITNTKTKK